jgi:hypothetical protein
LEKFARVSNSSLFFRSVRDDENDTQHNDIHHDDTQHNNKNAKLSIATLYSVCCQADCHLC